MSNLYDFSLDSFLRSILLKLLSSSEGKKLVIIWSIPPIAFFMVSLSDYQSTASAIGAFGVRYMLMRPFGNRDEMSPMAGHRRSLLTRV